MSTQPFSSLSENSKPFSTEATEEHRGELKSLLDEPWKITILPEPPRLPPGVLPAPEPHVAKSLPWRRGDVTRLKDDSPKGMMEYIASHTNGWWQELAERALRDNEKAERLARKAGWQPGQYWSLEVDAEAKQKLLDAEEAKRQREEVERAKEAAEKEAFMQRQMELLKKAGRAPRCEYLYTDGRGCRAPQVKGDRWCHGHAKMMSYRPEKLELEPMEDERAVMVNLYRVTRSLLAGRISEKTAGLMLWSVAIGMPGARRLGKPAQPQRARRKNLSRMNAETRRSGKKQLAKANWQLKKSKPFEPARAQRKQPKSSPPINTDGVRKQKNHPGVANDKSFISGVGGRVPLGKKSRESRHRENSLTLPGNPQRSRDLSTPPRVADAGSESLKMTGSEGRRNSSKHREISIDSHSSVSRCLRGENGRRGIEELQNGQGGL